VSDRPASDARPNHLAGETSPYLLQHLYNPVDWYPWSPDALERARREDRPIFLSIGYSACHWCHVMERESFEDARTAELLNRYFVPIKVDREERPDIDEIYMNAVQLLTGHGGWPMSVFLTPELQPFIGGTYFPPEDRHGMPAFRTLLQRVHDAWTTRRDEIERSAGRLTEQLREIACGLTETQPAGGVGRRSVAKAAAELAARFDPRWGGFGAAPKFPAEGALALLLDEHSRSKEEVPLGMVETTLDRMARGGIYDHVGGGFARYSVDDQWLVPHFEKMLYNQALLVPIYVDAWQVTRKPLYRRVAEQTLDFVRREMTAEQGGFYSSLDADSEGEEGKFYVWSRDAIDEVLGGDDGRRFREVYGITAAGNFEGHNIPNLLAGSLAEQAAAAGLDEEELDRTLEPWRARLLVARAERERPSTDDKILTAWNGLMISAFSRAHQLFGRARDLESARRAAEFALQSLWVDGRLRVSWRGGRAKLNAYLDDYAFLARGLLDLYEADFVVENLKASVRLARTMVERYEDRERGGFFFTSDDHEALLTRNRSQHDGALPAGMGVAVELLLRLAVHTDDDELRRVAERALDAGAAAIARNPSAHASSLLGAVLSEEPPIAIAIVGNASDAGARDLLKVVRDRYRGRPVVQVGRAGTDADPRRLLRGKTPINRLPTAFVCHESGCRAPVTDPDELAEQLAG